MFQLISLALLIVSGLVYPGGGVLAEIDGGGGIQTTITLVDLDSLPAPYTLTFYDNNRDPRSPSTHRGTA